MRPHALSPAKDTVHLVIAYKNFAAFRNISHIGLGVSAVNNQKVLLQEGFHTEVWPILSGSDLGNRLAAQSSGADPITHVVISAAWVPVTDLASLANTYPSVDFTVVSHSNIGFLQADPNAFTILRGVGDLETGTHNVHLGANCRKLINWWSMAYRQPMRLLPNMYFLTPGPLTTQLWRPGQPLRIGCFGAIRPLKNLVTAGAAALEIADRLQVDLSFYVSGGRTEGGAGTVIDALEAMYVNLPTAKLVMANWASWPAFRRTVRSMDLMLQPSFTESFNMVTADGVAEGVPSVTSDAITWVPQRWIASVDDAGAIADVGIALLHDPNAASDGLIALQEHNAVGLRAWRQMLTGQD